MFARLLTPHTPSASFCLWVAVLSTQHTQWGVLVWTSHTLLSPTFCGVSGKVLHHCWSTLSASLLGSKGDKQTVRIHSSAWFFFSWIRINDLIFLFVSGITLFSSRIFSAPTGKNKLVTTSYSANASKCIFYSFTFHHFPRLFLCLWNNSPATQSRTGSSARILTKSQHDIIIMTWQQMFMIKTLNLISFTYLQGEPEKTDENVTTVYSPFPLVFPCLEKLLFQLQLFFRTCGNHHHKYIRYYQCFHYSLFFITPLSHIVNTSTSK